MSNSLNSQNRGNAEKKIYSGIESDCIFIDLQPRNDTIVNGKYFSPHLGNLVYHLHWACSLEDVVFVGEFVNKITGIVKSNFGMPQR